MKPATPHPKPRPALALVRRTAGAALVGAALVAMPGRAGTPSPVEPAPSARIIVTLKVAAPLLREHALSVRQSAGVAAAVVQRRADRLGERAGVPLTAGAAISERAQVMLAEGVSAATLARRLAADPDVESAVVDQRRRALRVPGDPLFALGPVSGRGPDVGQWYLRAPDSERVSAVNAEAAWDRITGQASVVVAVLDTGVLADHLDLAGRVLPGYDMISELATANDGDGRDADASDAGDWITAAEDTARNGRFKGCGVENSSWHGTLVSGIIGAAADNGQGMAGTAFGVRILPVRVLGKCGGYDSDIQAGMRWAAGLDVPGVPRNPNPARVLNMSLGSTGSCDSSTTVYAQVIAEVMAAGAVVVAAAGNSVGQVVGLPANCPGVIGVGALRHIGSKVGYSDLGPQIAISAPGGNCVNVGANEPCLYPILSSSNSGLQRPDAGGSTWTDGINFSVGTSFSAPIVAGVAALMLSAQPLLTPAELQVALQSSARPFPTSGAGDDNGQPVPMCRAPDSTEQAQCYCAVGLCGAGMLDAPGAVAAALGTVARIAVDPPTPAAGESLRLSAAGSLVGAARSITGYQWSLLDTGGVVTGFVGASDAVEAVLMPTGPGTVIVSLTLTDDAGQASTVQRSILVADAPVVEPPAGAPSGGGGGASSLLWVALLGLAVWALRHTRHTAQRRR